MNLFDRWTPACRTDPDRVRPCASPHSSKVLAAVQRGRPVSTWWPLSTAILSVLLVASYAGAQNAAPSSGSAAPGQTAPVQLTPEQIEQALKAREQQTQQKAGQEQQGQQPVETPPQEEQKAPVKEEPSTIERLISGETPTGVSTGLRQFGYDVFSMAVSTFAPVTNVPVGPDYIIGPGDGLTLTLWGRVDAQHTLVVDQNGQIVLPEVGALKVWGMRFGELEGYLQHELSRKYTDFKMSVTMDRLRVIRVFVVGEASAPGSYTVSSLSTVINGLFAAGGPSKNGTLRKIRLLRGGAEAVEIDLYKFLLGGEKGLDSRLQDGDTIFIPLIGPVVGVAGNVKRPAIYEMGQSMTLQQVLDLAGGITFAGWLQRVQIERIENHEKRIVADFDLSENAAPGAGPKPLETVIRDGDVVKVFSVVGTEQNIIQLDGHVKRPGMYEFKPGMKLSDVLNYDAFEPEVNLEYGEIERLVPPDLHPIIIPFHPREVLSGDASANLELARLDRVRLFRWDEKGKRSVTVSGMVYEPNEYRLVEGMRVKDLVNAAGGLQKNAYLRSAEITRSHISQDGVATEEIVVDLGKALAEDPKQNVVLRDYDHLIVRPIPDLHFGRTAMIEGQVKFPGTYPIVKGETLSSLIQRAGGYTSEAYLKGAIFTRESAKEVQRQRLNQLISELEQAMLTSTSEATGGALEPEEAKAQQASLATKKELLTKLRAAQVTGRVVVRLTDLEDLRGSKYDIELEDKDTLTIPATPGVVYVVGEVFNPISLQYEKDRTVSYYLDRVGGMTKEADKKQVSVVKADGSVISMEQGNRGRLVFWDSQRKSWFFGGFMSMEMDPGDTIVVPRKMDRFFWLKSTKDLTQIVFQIAVAAGIAFAI
jgi:polysaccharide export outer membrane protein